jgi:Tripartite tricarboxylate transporter TctB family
VSRRAQENLIAAGLLALFCGVIWLCQDFGPRARMIPLPLAVLGIVLTVIQLLWQNLGSTDELRMDMIKVEKPGIPVEEAPAPEAEPKRTTWRDELAALGIVGVLLLLVLGLGPIPAVFLFTGGYFLFSGEYSWRASLIYTALLTASIYLLFVVALQMQLYHGLLAPLVERFS